MRRVLPGPGSRLHAWGALALGALATLGFPPFDFWPAPVLALAGLFALCAQQQGTLRAAWLGGCFGFGHFATGIYWVFISTHVFGGAAAWLAVLLAAVLFAYLSLYPALFCALVDGGGLWRSPAGWLAVPLLWAGSELLRGWVYTGFPWLSLGYAALDSPAERLVPLIGTHGLSAVFVLSAFGVFRAFDGDGARVRLLSLAAALAPLGGVLAPAPAFWTRDVGEPMSVAIVQGNVPQDQKWDTEQTEAILGRYRAMSLSAADADLIAWPEAVPNRPLDEVLPYFEELDERLREGRAALLSGVLIYDDAWRVYNSMIALGHARGRYDKRHLVPFGEYFPIPGWLRPIMDVLDLPYGDISSGGEAREPIEVRGQALGISICFEDVFGAEFAAASRHAGLLVNATNDAWFARSSAAHQHLQIARYRALENGRWLVRATNTGISALIAPDGRIVARSGHYTTEVLRGTVQAREGATPYVRWRDAPLWALSGLAVLVAIARRVRARRGGA